MDPNECLIILMEFIRDGFWYDAGNAAEDLADWLMGGGFSPDSDLIEEFENLTEKKFGIETLYDLAGE